jgi:hypothetical protein
MSEMIHKLATKAGIVKNDDHARLAEKHGLRGYIANMAELTEFARLVGQVARADERSKYERPDEARRTVDGGGDGKS